MSDADDSDQRFERADTSILPGDPRLENVLFVILGAVSMVLVILYLLGLLLGW
ncbi:MAG: hypothetical protein U5K37_02230 [Natrialbaceae archaeon]|nr:hypothetical protein [Natrialbaceae archaeon]